MQLIEWSDKYATGISGIDHEHRELVATINAFYSKLTQNPDKDELVNMLNEIYAAIHSHFMLEERLMKKHDYDEYGKHRDDHARLLDVIRDFTTDLEKTTDYDELQLKKKLNDWFLIHFSTHDARLHKLEQLIANQKEGGDSLISKLKEAASQVFSNKK